MYTSRDSSEYPTSIFSLIFIDTINKKVKKPLPMAIWVIAISGAFNKKNNAADREEIIPSAIIAFKSLCCNIKYKDKAKFNNKNISI